MPTFVITGNVGTGKTTLATLFKAMKATVISADAINADLLKQGINNQYLAFLLGLPRSKTPDQAIDKSLIRDIIASNKHRKTAIEHWLHPLIKANIDLQRSLTQAPITVLEIPLFFETKSKYAGIDRIILITCSAQRLAKQLADKSAKVLLKYQQPDIEKLALADDIVFNLEDISTLQKITGRLISRLDTNIA